MQDETGLSARGGPGCMEGYAGDGCWGEGGDVRFKGFGGVNFVDGGHVYFWSVLGELVVWGECQRGLSGRFDNGSWNFRVWKVQ